MAEGAPLLREYVGKTCIEGSNPSGSANEQDNTGPRGPFCRLTLRNSSSELRAFDEA